MNLNSQQIRILVVDDHPIVRSGLIATLGAERDMEVVGSAAARLDAVRMYREHRPDITLMDVGLDGATGGIAAIQEICGEYPEAKIIVFSALRGDEDVFRALSAGAITFLSKETTDDELVGIIREVRAGGRPIPQEVARKLADRLTLPTLTKRETEILKLIADGLRNKEIAGSLGIGEETVQGHIKNILSKLKVNDRTKAAIVGIRRGLIHLG
jgi:DNA-binding NarL/FixJ family response regulator